MILGGGILRSGGRTKIILVIDCLGTWCVGIPLCLLAAYGLRWGIVGVYALLNAEEAFRLVLSLVMFRRRSWMVSLSKKQSVPRRAQNARSPWRFGHGGRAFYVYFPSTTESLISFSVSLRSRAPPSATVTCSS